MSMARVPGRLAGGEAGGELHQAGDDRPYSHDQDQDQRGGARPGQRDGPGGQVGQAEQQVPDDRAGVAAAERPRGLQPGGDERVDGEQDDQRQHRDRGPG
jgi:hypothetical protein